MSALSARWRFRESFWIRLIPTNEGASPLVLPQVEQRVLIVESGCLRVQPKAGGKLHLRLNITVRPIANKYREGKLQRTLKREFKRTWNHLQVNRWTHEVQLNREFKFFNCISVDWEHFQQVNQLMWEALRNAFSLFTMELWLLSDFHCLGQPLFVERIFGFNFTFRRVVMKSYQAGELLISMSVQVVDHNEQQRTCSIDTFGSCSWKSIKRLLSLCCSILVINDNPE